MTEQNIKLEKIVLKVGIIDGDQAPSIYIPKGIFKIDDEYSVVAIKKGQSDMIKIFPFLKNQRLFEVYAEIEEGKLDKFYQSIVKFVAQKEGLSLMGMDGICTKTCVFDGCLLIDGFAEPVIKEMSDILGGLEIVTHLEINEVK